MSRRIAASLAATVILIAGGAHGTDAFWPAHPIRIVVAQAPGGPSDLIGRFVAERLARMLGSPVVVDNRPGASDIIGVEQVARSVPDGHTLLIATMSTHVLVPRVTAKVPYDPIGDFVPASNLFRTVKALWVSAALPPRSLREFVDYAAARPGQLNYATGGVGSSNHVDAAWFVQAAGLDLVHVPYNGPAAGTPPDVVERLNAVITVILREPETVDWADRQGMEIAGGSRADFARTLERDRQRWGAFLGRMRIAPH